MNRFELAASLRDNASPGIRRIAGELRRVRVEPGMAQAQKWVKGFNADVAQFKKSSLTVANVMTSMGVGGLAAGASIGALASEFKKLADHVLDVKELGREIGITTDELRAMERAGQHFGFDPSQMEGALKRLAGLMPVFRRGGTNELTQALARAPELMAKVRGEADDTAAVFRDIMGYVGKLQNPQDRTKFYEQIFGSGDLEKLNAEGVGGFEVQVERARKALGPMTQEAVKQAQAVRDAILDFNDAVDRLELKVAPTVFKAMKEAADDFREALGPFEKAAEWLKRFETKPGEAAADAAKQGVSYLAGAAKDKAAEIYGRWSDKHFDDKREGKGEFAPAKDPGEAAARLASMRAELATLDAKLKADTNPVGFPAREADTIARVRELRDAIATLRGDGPKVVPVLPPAPWKALVRPAAPEDDNLGLPGVDKPPSAPAFHAPSAYDREMRARGAGGGHSLDGFVVGALEKPILHLSGTLRTAAAAVGPDGFHQAAFHPTGLVSAANMDPQALLAAGVKEGMLAAMREWAGGTSSSAASTARDGVMPASFGGGGFGRGGNPALGRGGFGGPVNLSGGDAQGAEADRIREMAKKYGIDPRVALAVAKSEGLGIKWGTGMDHGTSFGAFQLHVGGGLGDTFQRETGLDPRNQANADAMDDWALRYASKHGWGDWHGAARIGVRGMAGIGGRAVVGADLRGGDIPGLGAGGSGGAGGAVDALDRLDGATSAQVSRVFGSQMHIGQWCADAVNASLHTAGIRGSGSSMALSFRKWGERVGLDAVKRGDVIVENYGGGRGHVGFATGAKHFDKEGRLDAIGMTSGNHGNRVHRDYWESVRSIEQLRRSSEGGTAQALRAAAEQLRGAAGDQRQAARVVAQVPDWHRPDRPDLDATMRRAGLSGPPTVKVDGGVDAHVTLHDNRHTARVDSRGHVRDAGITVRRGPQRTFTV